MYADRELVISLIMSQAKNLWNYDLEKSLVIKGIEEALYRCECTFSHYQNDILREKFNPYHSVQYSIFLYYLSRYMYEKNYKKEADVIYYLNKNLNNVEWFYEVKLPKNFGAEHPLGSVLGKAQYGDYLFVYQGTTIGGNRRGEKLYYPRLGNNIIMYAHSSIIGECNIGNNVIIAANTHIINRDIPDNCIVYGRDREVEIVKKTEEEIKDRLKAIWDMR